MPTWFSLFAGGYEFSNQWALPEAKLNRELQNYENNLSRVSADEGRLGVKGHAREKLIPGRGNFSAKWAWFFHRNSVE